MGIARPYHMRSTDSCVTTQLMGYGVDAAFFSKNFWQAALWLGSNLLARS